MKKNFIKFWREHRFLFGSRGRLAGRILGNYARLLLTGGPVLRGVEFAITYRCQLSCKHCLKADLLDPEREELSPDEVGSAVDACLDLGALNINLTGGEPLLREDLFEIIPRCRPDRNYLTLATNGLALTPEIAQRLSHAGVRMLSVSLDGARPGTHDKSRGEQGCHERTLRAISCATDAGLKVSVCTILRHDLIASGEIWELVELSQNLADQLTINLAYSVGGWAGRPALISEEDRQVFHNLLALPGVRWEGSSNYLREGCPAGNEKLYITPHGDVMPCACIHTSFGNIRQTPLESIYRRMSSSPLYSIRNDRCLVAENETFIRSHFGEY